MKQAWQIKKLGEIAEYFIGLTYSPKDVSDKGIVVLRSSNIQNDKLDFSNIVRVNRPVKDSLIVQNGDILMCSRNGSKRLVGKTATIQKLEEDMTFGTFMTIVRSQYNSYLSWFFKSDEFRRQINGGENPMINQITKYMLNEVSIPLPPIPDQKRIVKILDEAFAAIDKANANAEKNLQNSQELFDSYLNKVFANPGKDWIECLLNDYIKFIDYRGRTPEKTTHGMRLITAKNIKNGFLQKEPEEFVNPNIYDSWMTRGIPQKGDILFTTEAPLANIAQLDTDEKVVFAQRTIIFQPDPKLLNQSFLKYLLLSKPIKARIIEKGTGATVKGIKARLLKQIPIYFPKSLDEQESIVNKLDNLSDEIKNLKATYQHKLNDLEELKKTILQKAFDGQL